MISRAVPVSPSLGKMRVRLLTCASAFMSVIASTASVTWNPHSCAWRAGDSTPSLVATPVTTTCVTAERLTVRVEVRFREGAPGVLGHRVVAWLLFGLRDQIGPARRKPAGSARLLRPARCRAADVDQHHRQPMTAERVRQLAGARHDVGDRMHRRIADDALLEIDHDEGGERIDCGEGHTVFFTLAPRGV